MNTYLNKNFTVDIHNCLNMTANNETSMEIDITTLDWGPQPSNDHNSDVRIEDLFSDVAITSEVSKPLLVNPQISYMQSDNFLATPVDKVSNNKDFFTDNDKTIVKNFVSLKKKIVATGGLMSRFKNNEASLQGSREQFESLRRQFDLVNTDCQKRTHENTILSKEFHDLQQRFNTMENDYFKLKTDSEATQVLLQQQEVLIKEYDDFFNIIKNECPLKRKDPQSYATLIRKLKEDNVKMKKTIKVLNANKPKSQETSKRENTNLSQERLNNEREQIKLITHIVRFGTLAEQNNSLAQKESKILKRYKRLLRNQSGPVSDSDVEEVEMPSSCSSADTGIGSSQCSEDEKCIQSPEYPPNGSTIHIPVYPEPRIQTQNKNLDRDKQSMFQNNNSIYQSDLVTEKRDIATSPLKINVKHISVCTDDNKPTNHNIETEEEVEYIFKAMKLQFPTISPFPATPINLPKTPKSQTKRLKKRPRKNLLFSRLMSYLHTVVSQCQNERKWLIRQRKRESKFCRPIIQKIVTSGLPKSATRIPLTNDTKLTKDDVSSVSTIEGKRNHISNPTKVSNVECRLETPQAPQFDVFEGVDHEVEEPAKTSSKGAKTKQKLKGLALLRHKIRPKYKIKMDSKDNHKNKDKIRLKNLSDVSSTEKINKEAYLNAVKVMSQVNSKNKNNKSLLMRVGSKLVTVDNSSASEDHIGNNNGIVSDTCVSQEILVSVDTNNDLLESSSCSPVAKRKRGRPRKEKTPGDENEAVQSTHKVGLKRKRGRPRKAEIVENKTVENSSPLLVDSVKNIKNVVKSSTLQEPPCKDNVNVKNFLTIIKRKRGRPRKEEKKIDIETVETVRVLRSHNSPEQKTDKFALFKKERLKRNDQIITSKCNYSNADTLAPTKIRNSNKDNDISNKLATDDDLDSNNKTPLVFDSAKRQIESSSYLNQAASNCETNGKMLLSCSTRNSPKIALENSDLASFDSNEHLELFKAESELIQVSDLETDSETNDNDKTDRTLDTNNLINRRQEARLSVELARLSFDDIYRLSHENEMGRAKRSNQNKCAGRVLRSSKSNSGSELILENVKVQNRCLQSSQNMCKGSNESKGECRRHSQRYSVNENSNRKHLSTSSETQTRMNESFEVHDSSSWINNTSKTKPRRITRLSANNLKENSLINNAKRIDSHTVKMPNCQSKSHKINASKVLEKHMISEKDQHCKNNDISSKITLAKSKSNTSNINCRLTSYDDLDLFNTDTDTQTLCLSEPQDQIKNVISSQREQRPKFSESFFGSKLLKYGVIKKKYNIYKSPDETSPEVLRIAEKLEEEVNIILGTPPVRQATRMRQMIETIKSINLHDLVRATVEYFLKKSRTNDVLCLLYTPPAPPMMKSEQIFLFVLFELKVNSPTIIEELLDSIEYQLLRLNCTPEFEQVESLSHWFAVLCRATNKLNRLRMFVADSLYCLSYKAAVLANQVIDVWRDVLPAKKDRLATTPLLYTIAYVLVYFPNEISKADPKVQQLKQKLFKLYGYVPEDMCESQVLEIYRRWILDLRENLTDKKNLRMAFTILCKRNGVDWCQKHVVSGMLMPIIHNHTASETAKTFCVSLLGYLMRPYPDKMRMHCELALNQLFLILDNNPCEAMQEALLTTMLLLKKHGAQRLLAALVAWRPKREPSSELETLIRHYVRDKPLRVWLNSIKTI